MRLMTLFTGELIFKNINHNNDLIIKRVWLK